MNCGEVRSELPQDSHRRRLIVDEDSALAPGGNLAAENERAVVGLVQAVGFENSGQLLFRGAFSLKDGRNHGALSPRANDLAGGLVAQKEGESVHQNRLPRAGLARQQVQPRAELDHQAIDDRVVLEAQLDQHRPSRDVRFCAA